MGSTYGAQYCFGSEQGCLGGNAPKESCAPCSNGPSPAPCKPFPLMLPNIANLNPNAADGLPAMALFFLNRDWAFHAGFLPGSTKIQTMLTDGANNVHGVFTTGSHQSLKTKNGLLDLRWHQNQGLDTETTSVIGNFDPGGRGGSFGFLHWLWMVGSAPMQVNFYSSEGGIERSTIYGDGTKPDKRDIYQYNIKSIPYFKYDPLAQTYYWYNTGNPLTDPQYVAVIRDRQGYCLYYNYSGDQLQGIAGDVGRLVPYFGYDADGHIDRVHMQDSVENDHRTTYYYYSGDLLEVVVEPEDTVTYFSQDLTTVSVRRTLDGDNTCTYFGYSGSPNATVYFQYQDNRVTYYSTFSGNMTGQAFIANENASRILQGARVDPLVHAYALTSKNIGRSVATNTLDSNSNLIGVMNPNVNQTSFKLNSLNLRTTVSAADGGVTYFGYGSNNIDIEKMSGPRKQQLGFQDTYFGYDNGNLGRRVKILAPLSKTAYFGYDSRGLLLQSLDVRGASSYYAYDGYNNLVVTQDTFLNASYFAYNGNGNVVQRMDSLGRATYFAFDMLDLERAILDANGDFTYFAYNKRGMVTCTSTSGNQAAYFKYDAFRNLTARADLLGGSLPTTYYTYNSADAISEIKDPNGNITQRGNDLRNLAIRSTDALGYNTYFVYDPAGNLTFVGDANSHWTVTGYNSVNRVTSIAQGLDLPGPVHTSLIKGHWNLNESSGTRDDDSGNNNDLTDHSVGSVAGVVGDAADFTASSSEFLSINPGAQTGLDGTNPFSISCWFKLTSIPASSTFTYNLVARWGNGGTNNKRAYRLMYRRVTAGATPELALEMSRFGSVPNSPSETLRYTFLAQTDRWYHVVVTATTSGVAPKMYFNGQYVAFGGNGLPISAFSAYFTLGCDLNSGSPGNFLDGALDEVYFFNKELNQKEVSQLAQQHVGISFSNDYSSAIASYYNYDLSGNRTVVQDPRGNTTYFSFDALERLVQQRDPAGNATYFGYDLNSNLTQTLNPRNFATYFGYDLLNRRTASRDAVGNAAYFGFDAMSNRVATRFADGTAQYFGYDQVNRLVQALDQAGFATYFGFDAAGNQSRIMDPLSRTTYFAFDQLSRQTAILNADADVTYFGYDLNGNLLRSQPPSDGTAVVSYYGYDGVNRIVQQLDPVGRAAYFAFDPVGNQTIVDLPGSPRRATYFGYDRFDRLCKTLQPTSSVAYFGYDKASNLTNSLNSRSYAAYFGYDALNRVTKTLDALNGIAYFGYDAVGNLTQQLDKRGFATYFTYDGLNRPASVTDALQNQTDRGYSSVGNLVAIDPPVGGSMYFAYEPRNLLTTSVDGAGDVTYFGFDGAGNRTKTQSPRGYGTYFGYDVLDRLSQVLDAESGTAYFGYDPRGNVVQSLDALSRATYFSYDLIDRLVAVEDALANTVTFAYDAAGNRAVEADALAHTTYYSYDVGDRLAAVLDPLLKVSYFGYDLNSNLAQSLDNTSAAVYFGYDALDRRTRILYPSESQYFGYDAGGNLVAMKDQWGSSYFGYDALSRLSKRVTPLLDATYYGYDGVSNLLRLQYPRDFAACYYGYDDAQRLDQVLSPSVHSIYYEYDASSNVTRKVLGNGIVSWAEFDRTDRMTTLRYTKSDGTGIVYFDYGRDAAGRIMRIARENDLNIYYEYDAIDRLTAEVWRKRSDQSQIYGFWYSYDAANNRSQMRRETTTGTEQQSAYFWYDAANELTNRVVHPGNTSTYYGYDANGALTAVLEGSDPTYFAYADNRLVSRVLPPSGAATYFWYDGRLSRYCINKAGTLSYWLWDGLNQLEERDQAGSLVARYTHGRSALPGIGTVVEVQRVAGGGTYYQYPLMDHRGTAYVVADESQNSQITYALDSFGKSLSSAGGTDPSVPNELIYQTNWLTLNIGNRTYGLSKYRIYDPELGIFLSRDFLPYLNKYRAWSNNPVGQVDKNGLASSDGRPKKLPPTWPSAEWQKKHDLERLTDNLQSLLPKIQEYRKKLDELERKGRGPIGVVRGYLESLLAQKIEIENQLGISEKAYDIEREKADREFEIRELQWEMACECKSRAPLKRRPFDPRKLRNQLSWFTSPLSKGLRGLWTGDFGASDYAYDEALAYGQSFIKQHSPGRGLYVFGGVEIPFPSSLKQLPIINSIPFKFGFEGIGILGYDLDEGTFVESIAADQVEVVHERVAINLGVETKHWSEFGDPSQSHVKPIALLDIENGPEGVGSFVTFDKYGIDQLGIYGFGKAGPAFLGIGGYWDIDRADNYWKLDYWLGKLPTRCEKKKLP